MRPTTWLSDPVAFFQSDSILYVYDFQTDRVVIQLTSLAFWNSSDPQAPELRSTDVASLVKKSMDLVANRLYKQKIEPATEIDEELPEINADAKQLEQVLVNLYLKRLMPCRRGIH